MRSILLMSFLSIALAGCTAHEGHHDMHDHGGPADQDDCCGEMPMNHGMPMKGDMKAPAATASAATTRPAGMGYACPMHPDVTSATPGTCPRCGMTLMPMKGDHDGHH